MAHDDEYLYPMMEHMLTEKAYEVLLAILCIKRDEATRELVEHRIVSFGLAFCPDAVPEIYHP